MLDTDSTVVEKPGAVMPAGLQPRLEFRDVTFSYGLTPVVHNINLEIPALVGRSGSGKSTLANLLLRLYDPDAGPVLLDGHDVQDLPVREYRACYGVVLQDPFLFDTTIEANLRLIWPDLDEAELSTSCARPARGNLSRRSRTNSSIASAKAAGSSPAGNANGWRWRGVS